MISVDITSMSFHFAQALQAQCYAVALLGRSRSVGFSGLRLRDSCPDAISYHLLSIESILISSPRWQICASNIQRSARILSKILWVSPKEIKQVYQYRDIPWNTVKYRDIPWYTVICRDICDICDTRWPCLPDLATWQAWSASTKAKTPSLKQHLQDICRMALNKEWFSRHQYGLCCIRTWNSHVSRYFMIFPRFYSRYSCYKLLLALDQFGSLFSFDMMSFCHSGDGTLVTIELLVIEIIIRVSVWYFTTHVSNSPCLPLWYQIPF